MPEPRPRRSASPARRRGMRPRKRACSPSCMNWISSTSRTTTSRTATRTAILPYRDGGRTSSRMGIEPAGSISGRIDCDVLVVGSGAGGLSAAVTARHHGLDVVVAEKAALFGGTTALSGGWLWIPNHSMQKQIGIKDSIEDASTYLLHEAGEHFDAGRVNAFLTQGPRMVDFFMRETAVSFDPSATFSDYHPDAPGGKAGGRSMVASAFDARELGPVFDKLRAPLPELTVFGVMIGSGVELVHFMRWSKSFASAAYVARRLAGHGLAKLFYGRGVRLTNGNALAGRLLKSAVDAGVRLMASSPARELIREGGAVRGAVLDTVQGSLD